MAKPCKFDAHCTVRAANRALASAGNRMEIKIEIMEITTSSSMSVNAAQGMNRVCKRFDELTYFIASFFQFKHNQIDWTSLSQEPRTTNVVGTGETTGLSFDFFSR